MLDKGRISAFQMAFMMYPQVVSTGILMAPSITIKIAEHDMWMTPLIASFIGFFIIYILTQLHKLYPNKSLMQCYVHILGSIPGKLIGGLFLFHLFHTSAIIVREYGEFLIGSFLPKTPLLVVMTSMMLVCNYTIRGGIETIARISQIIAPIILFMIFMLSVLLIPSLDLRNMLPVLENGWGPVLKSSFVMQVWYGNFILCTFILPALKDPEKANKWGMISVTAAALTLLLSSLIVLLFLGDKAGEISYPLLTAARFIHHLEFIENLEAIIMTIWVMGLFIQINIFFYGIALGTAQWLNLKDFQPLVSPISFLILVWGMWTGPNLTDISDFLRTTNPYLVFFQRFLFPLLLLVIAWILENHRKTTTLR